MLFRSRRPFLMHQVSAVEVELTVSSDYVAPLDYNTRLKDRTDSHGDGGPKASQIHEPPERGTISPREAAQANCSKAVVSLLLMAMKSEEKLEKVQVSTDRQGIPICRE